MNKKQKILLTMMELVVEQGVHATPMSQLARESNVAIGTIYHHFNNKKEIIEEIYKMIFKDYGVVLMTNLPEDDFKKQFETIWMNLYNYFITNPLAFKFSEWVGVPPIIGDDVVEQMKPYYYNVRDFFLRGIKEKKLRNIHLRLIVQISYGNVISAVRLKDKGELPMTEKQVQDAIDCSWDAVKYVGE
ncbi:MAG: TetR/AcrR family transcriptional regulator [Flavobacteriaceae bacterium]|nr:TetR/AcrR family transcriptional regulator [Flavobacteriaceae bacterium]RZV69585.1 MAG: TetR/AcrR family transcriptional regulator [Flavobacteriaceae bacterium]